MNYLFTCFRLSLSKYLLLLQFFFPFFGKYCHEDKNTWNNITYLSQVQNWHHQVWHIITENIWFVVTWLLFDKKQRFVSIHWYMKRSKCILFVRNLKNKIKRVHHAHNDEIDSFLHTMALRWIFIYFSGKTLRSCFDIGTIGGAEIRLLCKILTRPYGTESLPHLHPQ